MVGPQWRHLFAHVPGVVPEQGYFPVPETPTMLVGWYRGQEFAAVADPPAEFRLLTGTRDEVPGRRTRAARPVCAVAATGCLERELLQSHGEPGEHGQPAHRCDGSQPASGKPKHRQVHHGGQSAHSTENLCVLAISRCPSLVTHPAGPALRPQWTDRVS
jgi:hypothetical protein